MPTKIVPSMSSCSVKASLPRDTADMDDAIDTGRVVDDDDDVYDDGILSEFAVLPPDERDDTSFSLSHVTPGDRRYKLKTLCIEYKGNIYVSNTNTMK